MAYKKPVLRGACGRKMVDLIGNKSTRPLEDVLSVVVVQQTQLA